MSENPKQLSPESSKAFLFVGITFLAVAVVFLVTQVGGSALWISFFTLGMVFFTLSVTTRRKPEADATEDDEKPNGPAL